LIREAVAFQAAVDRRRREVQEETLARLGLDVAVDDDRYYDRPDAGWNDVQAVVSMRMLAFRAPLSASLTVTSRTLRPRGGYCAGGGRCGNGADSEDDECAQRHGETLDELHGE